MEHRIDRAEAAFVEPAVERIGIDVIRDRQVGQVAEFIAVGEIVHRDDLVDSTLVQPSDDVAADEARGSGNHHSCHANSSS